jgi:hypothetical protein
MRSVSLSRWKWRGVHCRDTPHARVVSRVRREATRDVPLSPDATRAAHAYVLTMVVDVSTGTVLGFDLWSARDGEDDDEEDSGDL